jgi:hypothetical protein
MVSVYLEVIRVLILRILDLLCLLLQRLFASLPYVVLKLMLVLSRQILESRLHDVNRRNIDAILRTGHLWPVFDRSHLTTSPAESPKSVLAPIRDQTSRAYHLRCSLRRRRWSAILRVSFARVWDCPRYRPDGPRVR